VATFDLRRAREDSMTKDAAGTGAGSIAGPTIVGPLKEKDLPEVSAYSASHSARFWGSGTRDLLE
jgi:hypothetical protein